MKNKCRTSGMLYLIATSMILALLEYLGQLDVQQQAKRAQKF
jgi:hypothetical protein